ncbi:MAG TPA: general secretion pathway protein GspB [Steroidobacteraceae bacterium]|jgi:general secretion pathway protein B|nr:general secretion pathway protein GspB [Steroidobacteraceae bacterium]
MSFILDALKKSENDRQRQSGPALFEVRVAPPRSRFPLWAIAVAVLLVVNLSVIAWLMMRRPASAAAAPIPVTATPPPPVATQAPPVTSTPLPAPPPQQYAEVAPQVAPPVVPNEEAPSGPPNSTQNTYQGSDSPTNRSTSNREPALADDRAPAAEGNPDDYAPAQAPGNGPLGGGHVRRGTESGLPTYEDVAAKDGLPPLHLDLHVYAPEPRKRFVLLNMKRLYEGDSLPQGVRVDSITNDGAVLSYRGTKFVMDRE